MFPLSDDSPRRITPIVTWSIIAACLLVFLWQSSLGPKSGEVAIYQYGMIPARLFGVAKLSSHIVAVPAWATVLTSMFLHGGWLHLGLNMLFLWVFGGKVEDSMGHSQFLVFYLLCGVAAAVAQAIMSPGSTLPMVGASGAISGVLGAYFLLHPLASIRVLFFLGFIPIVAHIPALIFLGLWFAAQIASATFSVMSEPGIAVWAHVGGFLTGMLLTPFLRQRSVKLLQPRSSRAFQIERFVAGFVAVLIFHQGLWYLFNLIGLIPPERPAWPLDPIPPFSVPSVISKAFWGGVWGAVLVLPLSRFSGASYWGSWILVGAIALPLVGFFVVPPLKGEPIPELWPRFLVAMLLNGTWGFGTAFLLRLAAASVPLIPEGKEQRS